MLYVNMYYVICPCPSSQDEESESFSSYAQSLYIIVCMYDMLMIIMMIIII